MRTVSHLECWSGSIEFKDGSMSVRQRLHGVSAKPSITYSSQVIEVNLNIPVLIQTSPPFVTCCRDSSVEVSCHISSRHMSCRVTERDPSRNRVVSHHVVSFQMAIKHTHYRNGCGLFCRDYRCQNKDWGFSLRFEDVIPLSGT